MRQGRAGGNGCTRDKAVAGVAVSVRKSSPSSPMPNVATRKPAGSRGADSHAAPFPQARSHHGVFLPAAAALLPSATMNIEFALLADYAEIVGGKLYLMGGGWDVYHAPEAPVAMRLAIALGVRVGWDETNQAIPVNIVVVDDDAQQLAKIEGSMTTGRPPALPPGASQLSQLAANLPLTLQRFGGFRVEIAVGAPGALVEQAVAFRLERR